MSVDLKVLTFLLHFYRYNFFFTWVLASVSFVHYIHLSKKISKVTKLFMIGNLFIFMIGNLFW